MKQEQILDAVLAALLKLNVVSEDQCAKVRQSEDIELNTLNLDSMGVFNLCLDLEEIIGREIQIPELVQNPSVRLLAKHLANTLPTGQA